MSRPPGSGDDFSEVVGNIAEDHTFGTRLAAFEAAAQELDRAWGQVLGFRLLDDRVLAVLEDEEEGERLVGEHKLIYAPSTVESDRGCRIGRVVAVGPGRQTEHYDWNRCRLTREPVSVSPGDRIVLGQYAGAEFRWEGREFVILRENDIYAVLKGGQSGRETP